MTRYGVRQSRGLGWAALLIAAWLVGACATGSGVRGPDYDIPSESSSAELMDQWFADGELEAEIEEEAVPEASADRLFTGGEVAYWAGDVERAFDLHSRLVRSHPEHPLVRYGMARLYQMRDDVADFRNRVLPILKNIPLGRVEPLARIYLSYLGQTVHHRRWQTSEVEEPFEADALGFPTSWRLSPRLSPWRITDFARRFPPEREDRLSAEYRAPWFAVDEPVNSEGTRPYESGGLTLSPTLRRNGIYYLETYATLSDEAAPKSYWLYGDFAGAARVWVDGELMLERKPAQYGTGERWRRITLEAGRHRILVKLGFERGGRDWFDLTFLADDGYALRGSDLSFRREPPEAGETSDGAVQSAGEMRRPGELEPAVQTENLAKASDTTLYLTALAAYYDEQPRLFRRSWRELVDRHPTFAAGYGLKADQVRTVSALPGSKRRARAVENLREARRHAPNQLRYALELARILRERNAKSDEAQKLLRLATRRAVGDEEGRLRNREALDAWARYLEQRRWNERAEDAWERSVEADPTNCDGARSLQRLWASRNYVPPLEKVTPQWKRCPELERWRVLNLPGRAEERLGYYRRRAERRPYSPGRQIRYADELRRRNRPGEAKRVLREARKRNPEADQLWVEAANLRYAQSGRESAVELLERAVARNGASPYLERRLAKLRNREPLTALLRNGRRAAMEHLERLQISETSHPAANSSDEAYYLIDFAARRYAENGASTTLTHTVTRVMTKDAVDRFGETSIPGGAELLRVRTINRDGTVKVPDGSAAKSTLSMPDLDPGDFVELAYLRRRGPSSSADTHVEGVRFYFQMPGISSLHSEYAIVGSRTGEFMRQNDPPEADAYRAGGFDGVHFVRRESSRPRREPYSADGNEYLPWIQYFREGFTLPTFEVNRRYVVDRIRGSLELSHELEARVDDWRSGTEPGSKEEAERLFYRVAERITDPEPENFRRDASHALVSREGSPHLLLHAAYQIAGLDSEIYLVKSEHRHPDTFPIREFRKYGDPMVRVEYGDDEVAWLNPSNRDAMFGAANLSAIGQPAVCVSCEESERRTVPEEGVRRNDRVVEVEGSLAADGGLSGQATVTYHGVRAVSVRANLRETPETSARRKYMSRLLNALIPGSSLREFSIERSKAFDRPLVVELAFERPNFATATPSGGLKVQTALFEAPVADNFGQLRERERPLMIPHQRESDYELRLELPDGYEATVESRSGNWSLDSKWGEFSRSVGVNGGELVVTSQVWMPIQRVSREAYPRFRRWAFGVQKSSQLSLVLEE